MKKPALLCSFGIAIALIAPASSAQTDAAARGETETEALTDKARQLYDEGFAALNRSRWAEAHAAFLAAWRIKQHYQIASNLGAAELRLGKHRDAAEHLSWYLREAPAERTAQRQRAEALLKEALAKVAAVTVTTAPEGAEVTVDGAVVGRTPLALPVFLEPGQHEISAELDGYTPERERIEPKAGEARGLTLHLEPARAEAPAMAGASVRAEPPAKVPEAPAEPRVERSWVPVIALGAVSVVGLGVGVGMTVASNDAVAEKDERKQGILREGGQCVQPSAAFVERCKALRNTGSRADTFGNGARIAYIASGALAAAAVTYLLWPRANETVPAAVLPQVHADGAGITVLGAF